MATTKAPKLEDRAAMGLIDLTKTGPLSYRELQALNNSLSEESVVNQQIPDRPGSNVFAPENASQINYTGNPYDEYGQSTYDSLLASMFEYQNYSDLRGQKQPWYLKLLNGTLKGVITAGTTFVNGTLGLIYGLGTLATEGRLSGIWDNEVTNAMQTVTEGAEQLLPNYYTDEERNSPWYTNIFSANFLGDKFIKNIGFSVGALLGGGIYSKALQAVKWMPGMLRAGTAAAASAVNEGSLEALNGTRDWYNLHKKVLGDQLAVDLNEYKESFRSRLQEIEDEYQANKGTLVRDPNADSWAMYDPAARERDRKLAELRKEYERGKEDLYKHYDQAMTKLSEDRAKMGNIAMLLNIPIITASHMFQFGKLLANGFKTANRTSKIFKTAEGTYAPRKSTIEPLAKGVGRSLWEGFEEINQEAASEIPGNYYSTDVMNYYKDKTDPDAEKQTLSWLNSFAEGITKTYGEGSSWEEFFIGALTGALGVPIFGKANTSQAYLGKGKSVGMVGGIFDAFSEYKERVARDTEIANALNERVKSPDFLNYYQGMIRHYKLQKEMDKAVDSGDEFEFKNHEHSQMVNDIAMWDNAGKLDDLIQMINEAADTSPENIKEIIRQTTNKMQSHPQYQKVVDALVSEIQGLQGDIDKLKAQEDAAKEADDMSTYNDLSTQRRNLESQMADKESQLESEKRKRDLFVGSFVDEKGNPYTESDIIKQIESNKKDILDAVELYRKTKRDIDSQTYFALNSEQLATLTWMKTHKENWDSRAATMAGEIKEFAIPAILDGVQREMDELNEELNNLPEILGAENSEKAKKIGEDMKVLMDIKDSLSKMQSLDDAHFARALAIAPQMGGLMKLAMAKPEIAQQIHGENVWELMKKVDDIIKASNASMQYNQKLMEYVLNPQSLSDDMAQADAESVQRFVARQTEQVRKNIVDNVKTVPQMREALQGLGENHDAVVEQLMEDEDERVANLAKAYQQVTSLQRVADKELAIPPRGEIEVTGIEAARQTFQRIIGESNSADEVITKLNEEIAKTQQTIAEDLDDERTAGFEIVVANKLQDIVNAYEEAKKAKKTEGKDKKSKKKAKNDDKGTKKRKKKPSLLDDEDDTDDGANDDSSEGEKPGKKKRKKPSLLDDIDESEDISEDPDGIDEEGTPKHDITLEDVFNAYENKMGGHIAEETKQAMRDRLEAEDDLDVRSVLGDSELQDIYDELEAGTFEENLEGDDRSDKKSEGKKDKGKRKTKVDLSALSRMSVDEAIEYLENLNPKDLSKSDLKKARELLKKMYEKQNAPSAHEAGDEDNSNANDNDARIGNDPRFRSWGAYAKYMFQELNNRATRQAMYNSFPEAQAQLSALEELGAFDFVDRGELGKLLKAEPDIQIKYIKAKDKRLSDSILLAVEMTKERQRRAKAVRLITGQDGKQYQVVGVLGFSSKDDVANANWHEIDKAITKERGKDRPEFFVSDKFYNKIKHIYSGRMVKSGEIVSQDGNVSGDLEDRSLKQMLHGVRPIIGVYYNAADFRVPALPNGADVVPLNTNNSNPREGSVWLMVQEADGRYYAKAIKVRRFNVDEYDLEEHKDNPILQQIREDLEIICDPEASDIDRYSAKYDLQEHLLYFPEGLDILYNGDTVSIAGVDWGNNIGKGLSPQEKAQELLERLQSDDLNLRFQIDTSELSDSDYVRELLDSDVMTSDLLQAHNINASFDLYLNDSETGEPIEDDITKDGSNVGHTGNREVNTDLAGSTVNIGRTEYTLLSDGRVMKRNQEITDPNIITQVRLINNINKGLVNPIEGTNVYIGTYDDGTEFGIKKTKTSHTILDSTKLEEAKEKAKKLAEKKKKRKTLKETADSINSDKEDNDDEELLSTARRGGLIIAKEDVDERPSDADPLKDAERDPFSEEETPKPRTKPKKKGPKLIGLDFSAEGTSTPVTTKGNLEKLSRKRAARERIFGLVKDGKKMFDTLDSFYKYLQDPNNGLSNVEINTQEDLDSVLDTIENCR